MKYLKYIILTLVIAIIIVLIVMLNIVKGDKYVHIDEKEDSELRIEVDRTVRTVKDKNDYNAIKTIVESYYYDLMQFDMKQEDILILETDDGEEVNSDSLEKSIENEKQAYKNKIYNYLDEDYIEKNNITKENIDDKLGNYKDVVVIVNNMYFADVNENVKVYFVQGNVIEKENLKKENFEVTISIDTQNSVFEIYPSGKKYSIEFGKELQTDIKEIKNKVYNKYNYKIINDENYALVLFKDYKNRLIYDVESAYKLLNEEYSKKKFAHLEEFKKYVTNNYYKLINSDLKSYTIKKGEKDRILCIDAKGRYYIFENATPIEYEIILDTYTIDIPEFTEKYSNSNNQEKVILNLNKFNLALNDKDYKTAYSMLADSFKQKNFPNFTSFERYIKENLFEENKFDYIEFGDEAGTYYTYSINITDQTEKSNKKVEKKFIMLLEENTEFKLSFNI